MKQNTHPQYDVVTLTCSNCSATFTVGTTATKGFSVALCSQCHPAYTGAQSIIDTANRVSKFMERQKKAEQMRTGKK
ncbi:MAG: 50S ribosomal protein L31 [Candidatus Dojkabacteria bacterium]|nr:MAG: 50S ribosomal protein L31 [Candidatus Dojkabacteria bacterium]